MEAFSALPLDVVLKLLVPLGIAALLAFFWWRAGTTHSIMERLWRVIAGSSPIKDPRLAAFIEEARELERFRFIYGVKVDSGATLHKFFDWREKHHISIVQIQSIRRWIDTSTRHFIVEPRRTVIARLLLYTLLCFIGVISSVPIALSDSAYLKTKISRDWFVSDGTSVKRPFWWWKIESLQCAISQSAPTGFTAAEKEIICSSLQSGSLQSIVDDAVRGQRRLGQLTEGLFVFAMLYFARKTNAAIDARDLVAGIAKSGTDKIANAVLAENPMPQPIPDR